jgi:hypothetical protein
MRSALLTASLLLYTGAVMASGTERIANSPDTASSQSYSGLVGQGARALTQYVNSCANKNWRRLRAVLTDDAVVEYPLSAVGVYFAVDSANIASYCNTTGSPGYIAALTVFPGIDDSLLFVYSVQRDRNNRRQHLVEIKLRGDRISHLRDFTEGSIRDTR